VTGSRGKDRGKLPQTQLSITNFLLPIYELSLMIVSFLKKMTKIMNAQEIIRSIEAEQLKTNLPDIYVGDTVKVGVKIKEGNKYRVQPYEGVVIAKRNGGINETITVRRVFQGVGVERVFLLHSPRIETIQVLRRGRVRRAKLYYLRDRVGKATRIKQRFDRAL
jgi:large subunit ribosomal protein L19